jgi:hypothetical protein
MDGGVTQALAWSFCFALVIMDDDVSSASARSFCTAKTPKLKIDTDVNFQRDACTFLQCMTQYPQ